MSMKNLNEQLNITGAEFIGSDFNIDLYKITTWNAAQEFVKYNDNDVKAGEAWFQNQHTFETNSTIYTFFFFTLENTNKVIISAVTKSNLQANKALTLPNCHDAKLYTNYIFENCNGAPSVVPSSIGIENLIVPLYLLPNIQYDSEDYTKNTLIKDFRNENRIVGNYKGLANNNNLPAEFYIDDTIDGIAELAFKNCAIQTIIIPENVTSVEDNAFKGYSGRVFVNFNNEDELPEGWSKNYNPDGIEVLFLDDANPEKAEERRLERERLAAERAAAEEAARAEEERRRREEEERIQRENEIARINSADVESILKYKEVKGKIVILGCALGRKSLKIPATINGKPVKEVAPFAFYNNKYLEDVHLPDTIELIGRGAFAYCTNARVFYPKKAIVYADAFYQSRGRTR